MSMIWLSALRGKKRIPAESPLKNVRIASPCRANWDQMTGDERVRHCSECNLNVYNLSEMTRRAAEELIASREGRLCVRFFRRADGTILTRNCPIGLRNAIRRVSRVAGAALSAMMSVGVSVAQGQPQTSPQTNAQSDQKQTGISVVVTDQQGAVVQGAKVKVLNERTGKQTAGKTKADGSLRLSLPSAGSYKLEIESSGFQIFHKTLDVAEHTTKNIAVKLKVDESVEMGIIIEEESGLVDRSTSQVTNTFSGPLLQAPRGR